MTQQDKRLVSDGLRSQIQKMQAAGLKSEQIAQGLSLTVAEVDASLMLPSKGNRGDKTRQIAADRLDRAAGVLDRILDLDDFPHLQLSAAKLILEIDLGKHDGLVANQSPTSLTQINNYITQGLSVHEEMEQRFAKQNSIKRISSEVVELKEESTDQMKPVVGNPNRELVIKEQTSPTTSLSLITA